MDQNGFSYSNYQRPGIDRSVYIPWSINLHLPQTLYPSTEWASQVESLEDSSPNWGRAHASVSLVDTQPLQTAPVYIDDSHTEQPLFDNALNYDASVQRTLEELLEYDESSISTPYSYDEQYPSDRVPDLSRLSTINFPLDDASPSHPQYPPQSSVEVEHFGTSLPITASWVQSQAALSDSQNVLTVPNYLDLNPLASLSYEVSEAIATGESTGISQTQNVHISDNSSAPLPVEPNAAFDQYLTSPTTGPVHYFPTKPSQYMVPARDFAYNGSEICGPSNLAADEWDEQSMSSPPTGQHNAYLDTSFVVEDSFSTEFTNTTNRQPANWTIQMPRTYFSNDPSEQYFVQPSPSPAPKSFYVPNNCTTRYDENNFIRHDSSSLPSREPTAQSAGSVENGLGTGTINAPCSLLVPYVRPTGDPPRQHQRFALTDDRARETAVCVNESPLKDNVDFYARQASIAEPARHVHRMPDYEEFDTQTPSSDVYPRRQITYASSYYEPARTYPSTPAEQQVADAPVPNHHADTGANERSPETYQTCLWTLNGVPCGAKVHPRIGQPRFAMALHIQHHHFEGQEITPKTPVTCKWAGCERNTSWNAVYKYHIKKHLDESKRRNCENLSKTTRRKIKLQAARENKAKATGSKSNGKRKEDKIVERKDIAYRSYTCGWKTTKEEDPCGHQVLLDDHTLAQHVTAVHLNGQVSGIRCRWDGCTSGQQWGWRDFRYGHLMEHIRDA